MRDEDVRSSCFAALDVLETQFGDDLPDEITLPERRSWRPDRERLEIRYQRFLAASGG